MSDDEAESHDAVLNVVPTDRRQRFVVRRADLETVNLGKSIGQIPLLLAAMFLAPFVIAVLTLAGSRSLFLFLLAGVAQVVLFVGAFGAMGDATVDVGADGLLVTTPRAQRFIPYSHVGSVEAVGGAAKVVLTDGEALRFVAVARREQAALDRAALIARLERARAGYRQPTAVAPELVERLARGGRTVADWRRDVAAVPSSDGDYRRPAVLEESLWRVVEDGRVPEDARAAAALAVRSTPAGAPRLRVAAGAVVSPRLRLALETAADLSADEAALDAALGGIDDLGRAASGRLE